MQLVKQTCSNKLHTNQKEIVMEEREFTKGIFSKAPSGNAPDFIKAKMSFRLEEAIPYLQEKAASGEQWLNCEIRSSKAGKWFVCVDDWKPNAGADGNSFKASSIPSEDVPF